MIAGAASGYTLAVLAALNPPHEPHYLFIEEETVLQLTCEGPWELHYVE